MQMNFNLSKRITICRWQIPVILAYVMTIHKSQGMSISTVMFDVGNSILGECAGMMYVSLSRIRTLNGLHLINFDLS